MPTGKPPTKKCRGHRPDGSECGNWAKPGATVCRYHGGNAPQVKAMAAVRAELFRWGLGDQAADPGETLLRLVSQSAARAERYATELEQLVEQHGGDLAAAMIGETLILDRDGQTVKVGEYVRGLAKLENEERDRCANFAAKAIAAGIAERQVRIAEQQAQIVIQAVEAALDAAGVPDAQRGPAKLAAARHLKVVG